MTKHILHVVSNVANFDDPSHRTGLWLSELTHAWDVFAEEGHDQRIVSPAGGRAPLEPRALKWPLLDASAKAWLKDPAKMALLQTTSRPDEIDAAQFDAIYFTGGHAVMWDFPDSEGLQAITRAIADRVRVPVVASGGVGGLADLVAGVVEGHASAVLAASIFHFGQASVADAHRALAAAGVPVRRPLTGA